ncbi:homoserine O-acetyltransferase, partial [Rhizobium ruizarguesonis]
RCVDRHYKVFVGIDGLTGPATINPKTGKPWGMDFTIMTIGDFVDTQKGLMERLGIEKWHAVMGASMGGLQSYEWAA